MLRAAGTTTSSEALRNRYDDYQMHSPAEVIRDNHRPEILERSLLLLLIGTAVLGLVCSAGKNVQTIWTHSVIRLQNVVAEIR
jgi:hypothetical protein